MCFVLVVFFSQQIKLDTNFIHSRWNNRWNNKLIQKKKKKNNIETSKLIKRFISSINSLISHDKTFFCFFSTMTSITVQIEAHQLLPKCNSCKHYAKTSVIQTNKLIIDENIHRKKPGTDLHSTLGPLIGLTLF